MSQNLWVWGYSREPETIAETNSLLCEMIEQDEDYRSPILLGKHLGKLEERAWIRKCFSVAWQDQVNELVWHLIEGTFPKAFRQPDGPSSRPIFYQFEEDCPDGPMD
jgi:hypothetical protein